MEADKQEILKRLQCIEGHLGGIRKMLEEKSSCLDVLHQTYAVRKALQKLEVHLVASYLVRCVQQGIMTGEEEALFGALVQFSQLIGNP